MADRIFEEVVEKRLVWFDQPREEEEEEDQEDESRRRLPLHGAFSRYIATRSPISVTMKESNPGSELQASSAARIGNMNKWMIQLLKRNWEAKKPAKGPELQRGYKHMINERNRREKQKLSYTALHSMLPHETKNDKNSIIQAAATEIRRLQSCKEVLSRRNDELESWLRESEGVMKMKVSMANPRLSGADSMLQVLWCLKDLGIKPKAIRSAFSGLEFSAALEVETQLNEDTAKVEDAVLRRLHEAERKLPPK